MAIRKPTVVVDKDAEKHCVENIADAFVEYLHTPEAQDMFHSSGTSARSTRRRRAIQRHLQAVKDLFTTDDLGGWDAIVDDTVFGPDGAFTKAFQAVQG